MDDKILITKEDIENMDILSKEDIKKLNFHELCAYLNMLDLAENILKGCED